MRNNILSKLLGAGLILVGGLLAGCSAGGSSTVRYYTVNPVDAIAIDTPAQRQLVIEILSLHVPEYLERSDIATRSGGNSVQFSEFNQWAENLRKNLVRTMARNLAGMLGTSAISTPLSRSSAEPDYRLEIHVDQFEQDSDAIVKLAARWQLIRARDGKPLGVHSIDLHGAAPIPERDFDRMVGDMRELYGQLSRSIADDILAARIGQPE